MSTTSQSRRGVWSRLALATFVYALLVALGGLLSGPAVSAQPLLVAQTRVVAIGVPGSRLIGAHDDILLGQGRQRAPSYDQQTVGSPYLDGTLAASAGSPIAVPALPSGTPAVVGSPGFAGSLEEAAVYGSALGGAEVEAQYAAGASAPSADHVSYYYNGQGLLAGTATASGTATDNWDITASVPLLLSDGTDDYLYGPDGTPVEQASLASGTPEYFVSDYQGSTRALLGPSGSVDATFSYDAYGNLTSSTGTATTPLLYDGQYLDQTTGLYYLRARWYDPATDQFTTVDPDVAVTGEPYAYASDDPVNEADPTGLLCVSGVCLGFYPLRGLEGGANFVAGAANAVVSTATLGTVHVSAPFCGTGLGASYDIGNWTAYAEGGLAGVDEADLAAESSAVDAETAGPVASSMTSATGLARQLAGEEASSIFTESGGLQQSVIQGSHEIISGSELGNSEVVKSLTSDGSNIADWGKYTAQTFESPSGPFQVHFYYNSVTGEAYYGMDYKAVFNNGVQHW